MEAARLPYFSCVPRRSARIRVRSATPLGLEFRKNLDKLLKTEAILAYRVGYPKPEMQRATSRGGSRQVARAEGRATAVAEQALARWADRRACWRSNEAVHGL